MSINSSQVAQSNSTSRTTRLYYLDWLRVIAMFSIFLFHNNRIFTLGDCHISNLERSLASTIFEHTFNLWMMPLFFILSGAAINYSLKSRTVGQFVQERTTRILIPLVGVGIFILGPLQIYLDRLSHGEFTGNFFQFYPHYFDGLYGFGGNFAWMGVHLWYLMDLFLFSLVALPLFLPCGKTGKSILSRLAGKLNNPWLVLLVYLLFLGVASVVTNLAGLGFTEQMGSWDILSYFVFFIYGYLIFSNERIQDIVRRYCFATLITASLLTLAHLVLTFVPSLSSMYDSWPLDLRGLCTWSWIMALLGIGSRFLNHRNKFLDYANEAVLPFYILHQPLILSIGFFVVRWTLPIFAKYFIIASTSFVAIMVLYELLVRRINVLRFLFGMRLKRTSRIASVIESQT
jgi:glucan biosynthesis protein C